MDRKRILSYSKNIGTYFSASLIPMILNLVSNPFIAMNMEPEAYAITGYYTSFTTLLSPLITFYMFHYYMKRYFELDDKGRVELRATLMKSLIWFSGLLALVSLGGVIVYTLFFNKETSMPLFPYVVMTVMAIPLAGLMNLTTTDYRMAREANAFFKISVSNGVLLVVLNLIFVVFFKWSAFGKLLAPLVTNIVFFCYCLYRYRDLIPIPFNWDIFKKMVLFCWPLTIAAMLGFFSNGYDRVLLERLGNARELGYYCVGLQIATYVNVFQTAINSTFQPDIFQSIAERNKKRLLRVILIQMFGLCAIVAVFIVFCPLVIKILTAGRYMMSVGYSRILVLFTVTSLLYNTFSQITIALGYTKIPLINKGLSTIILIAMFGYLITEYQFIGAAWGMVLSYLVFFIGNVLLLLVYKRIKPDNSVIKNS